jgi:hypothetical protein
MTVFWTAYPAAWTGSSPEQSWLPRRATSWASDRSERVPRSLDDHWSWPCQSVRSGVTRRNPLKVPLAMSRLILQVSSSRTTLTRQRLHSSDSRCDDSMISAKSGSSARNVGRAWANDS